VFPNGMVLLVLASVSLRFYHVNPDLTVPGLRKSCILTNTSGDVTLLAVKGLSGGAIREILRYAQNDRADGLLRNPDPSRRAVANYKIRSPKTERSVSLCPKLWLIHPAISKNDHFGSVLRSKSVFSAHFFKVRN
jgi:hypothetical protein